MKTTIFCTVATLLASIFSSTFALDLKSEHAGGVISRMHGSFTDGVLHNGTASGRMVALGNGMLQLSAVIRMITVTHINSPETGYVTFPPGRHAKAAVLYMTDIFGLELINNKLSVHALPPHSCSNQA